MQPVNDDKNVSDRIITCDMKQVPHWGPKNIRHRGKKNLVTWVTCLVFCTPAFEGLQEFRFGIMDCQQFNLPDILRCW